MIPILPAVPAWEGISGSSFALNGLSFGFIFCLLVCVLIHWDVAPFPVPDFRHVLAVFVDILLVLDELVLTICFKFGALCRPTAAAD